MSTQIIDTETGEITEFEPAPASVLNAKLARVLGAVERIPKNGWNDFHKFKFATESDVSDAVRDELSKENIGTSMRFELLQLKEWHTPKGKDTLIAVVKCWLELRCGDTGLVVVTEGLGSGDDPLDKAVMKAETAAVKYALMKAFLIPTGDDPDAGSKHQVADAPPPLATDAEKNTLADRIDALTEANAVKIRETLASKGEAWETLTKPMHATVSGWVDLCEKAEADTPELTEAEQAAEQQAELDAQAQAAAEHDADEAASVVKTSKSDDDIPF